MTARRAGRPGWACTPEVKSPVVLVEGECLALAAALEEGPAPPSKVLEAALRLFENGSLDPLKPLRDRREAAMALALVFGGLVAVSWCPEGPPTPVARVYRPFIKVPLGLLEKGDRRALEVLTEAARGRDPWSGWSGPRAPLAPAGLECQPPYAYKR